MSENLEAKLVATVEKYWLNVLTVWMGVDAIVPRAVFIDAMGDWL